MANETKSPTLFSRFIGGMNHLFRSLKNFVRSSFLSLLIIIIILLLLTQMDQAFTMMVDLLEGHKFSLFLSIFFINALALALSHYPIYNYYAADLNNSGDYTHWHCKYPIRWWPFKKSAIYVFTTNPNTQYTPDNWANYLRYFTGILIHGVWIHFIISSFSPNFIFEDFPFGIVKGLVYLLLIVPFALYIGMKQKFAKLQKNAAKHDLTYHKLLRQLGIWYIVIAAINIILLLLILSPVGNFSPGGFVLLLLTNYALMYNYVFFRLLRTKITAVKEAFSEKKRLKPLVAILGTLQPLEVSEHYLLLYNFNFVVAIVLIVWSTFASVFETALLNGIPILLAFFYFYYFIIASLGKYFFVSKKLNLFGSKRYRLLFIGFTLLVALVLITNFAPIEVTTHELDLVKDKRSEIPESVFIDSLKNKKDNTLFFIASHGGGLKANVWTLNMLNTLQQRTDGKLLNQTIAFSGASGGSLGLALYTGLYKEHAHDFKTIQQKIDALAGENYTSLDLTLTFGLDTYRKLWPFNQRIGLKDRPYYSMRKYQNQIEENPSKLLSEISFRDYWKNTFERTGYFPSLIMNTAGTGGHRGILWSVKQENFRAIFPNAVNLADLSGNKTIPFYQAVSTTNRFPVFSPAAKIKGYGHFIDAGAIDNSGLLGCLDLHNYLIRDEQVLGQKQIAYIEISNSKSLYISHLLHEFRKTKKLDHIDINENETDNLIADLQTGLNLDKIPNYLSHYLENWERNSDGKIRYFKLMMPHKVTINNVESFLNGDIKNAAIYNELVVFLRKKNEEILRITEKQDKTFFDPWNFYEPTLSRHLSRSSLNYIDAILKHPTLTDQFSQIEALINTKAVVLDTIK